MLIQITPNQIKPFQKVLQTPDQSIIQPTFMQYKIYWHRWYILCYTLRQYLLIGVQVTLQHHHMTHQQKL